MLYKYGFIHPLIHVFMEYTASAFPFLTSFNKNHHVKIFQTLNYFLYQRRRNEIQCSDSAAGHFLFSPQQTLNIFLYSLGTNTSTLVSAVSQKLQEIFNVPRCKTVRAAYMLSAFDVLRLSV